MESRQKRKHVWCFAFCHNEKSKRIPSIFNDKSAESFICLKRHMYVSHVNKVQPICVKRICIAAIRVTCMKDFVSVVKILLKAFFSCSLFPYLPPHPQSALHAPHRIALPPLLPATSDTTHIVT
jgi:hypothetical protein